MDIENLTFGYTDEIVLDNVSLNIKPGEFVAIIGESGIGKTTLLRIIMSFMGNYTGKVDFFDENGLTDPANANTRRFISYVPQGEKKLTPAEKQVLKDEYVGMFKAELQRTKLEKSVEDMNIKEKADFWGAIAKKWTKADPEEFMSDKEIEKLNKTVVKN